MTIFGFKFVCKPKKLVFSFLKWLTKIQHSTKSDRNCPIKFCEKKKFITPFINLNENIISDGLMEIVNFKLGKQISVSLN